MSLHILHVTTPTASSPFLSAKAANTVWLPGALRERGHTVTVRVADEPLAAALAARREGFDIIHVHSDSGPQEEVPFGDVPIVWTPYGQDATPAAPWIALSTPETAVADVLPAAVIAPAFDTGSVPVALERGDEIVTSFDGRDGYALSAAIAVARHTERPLALLVPTGTPISDESRRQIERASRFVRVVETGVEWSPENFRGAACYLSFNRCAFDMGALTALATGLPVITFERFPASELIVHGESGFAVRSIEDSCHAVESLGWLQQEHGRNRARVLFDARTAAILHEAVYEDLVQGSRPVFQHPEIGPRDRSRLGHAGQEPELSTAAS